MQKVVDVLSGGKSHEAHSDPRKIYEDWEKIATGSYSNVYKVSTFCCGLALKCLDLISLLRRRERKNLRI